MNVTALARERGIEIEYAKKGCGIGNIDCCDIITNSGNFTGKLLKDAGVNKFHSVCEASIATAASIEKKISDFRIIGIGGGKALDVAKKVAFDLERELLLIPTAPSHDGLMSRNCSLYDGASRKTIPVKYAKKVIIPLELWENSGDLEKAGVCDLFSNIIALEDLSLAEKAGETFNENYKNLSLESIRLAERFSSQKELSEALMLSGFAMEETSRYCSGSEHEVERLLESKISCGKYLHGQLAGTGSLICAKIYSENADKLQDLLFEASGLFGHIVRKMEKKGVLKFALEPLNNERFRPEILMGASAIRPERHTLWNCIDSAKVDWNSIINEILKECER